MKPNIAVVYGGDSAEFVVSVESSKNVFRSIDPELYSAWKVQMKAGEWSVMKDDVKIADVDKSDFSFISEGKKIKFDYAYITIHGTPGENGILQGYLDLVQVPYSTCSVGTSALTFNKYFCSNFLRSFGIKMAESVLINNTDSVDVDAIADDLGLPLFVKPNAGGSSFGVTKVKSKDELKQAIATALKEDTEVLIEQFIKGTEFTCGLVKLNGKNLVFPVTEVLPKKEFFDFEAKYTKGMTDEITPARLPEDLTIKCQALSSTIYDLCRCEGIVRIDYILKDGDFYFLEVNTTPGMTGTSFVPQQIEAMGEKLSKVLSQIIQQKLK
ncbi:MAG: D-alanine--D-alanine ligase A [Bacteroidetes bacterium GWF2_42_66]|nr:MAG: D-alanine--D-alanine ligase A [Bacteroidetes bacterium GWA2_42_15]OFX99743.1 MAG: D-alanine--D-alanine ligase A [Bacteroidetes bacterium GWE2_42_39]OFY39781.1 MAG: D-alanine--D-alanine ligase A [Bacteroidetes bacterium GWF2_42_66]HBL74786.1 D-alanine--D-alanine ligase [Prolixibacteraceae bacterium]HCR90748.1 D-alanine--D-alanine ligase [Prolixibacteraceae bacterium]